MNERELTALRIECAHYKTALVTIADATFADNRCIAWAMDVAQNALNTAEGGAHEWSN